MPLVSLAGDTSVSRAGASLLHALGTPELAASTPDAFVSAAIALANDLDRLGAVRAGLRERMSASPLRDEAAFTRALEAAYVQMCRPTLAAGAR